MCPLKLLLFVGISVMMMVSVRGFIDYGEDYYDYDSDLPLRESTIPPPDWLYAIVHDQDVNEDNEKNAIIFDEPASTIPPPDLLHDVMYDQDVNEDYGKDAIIFDEPATATDRISEFRKIFKKILKIL